MEFRTYLLQQNNSSANTPKIPKFNLHCIYLATQNILDL